MGDLVQLRPRERTLPGCAIMRAYEHQVERRRKRRDALINAAAIAVVLASLAVLATLVAR